MKIMSHHVIIQVLFCLPTEAIFYETLLLSNYKRVANSSMFLFLLKTSPVFILSAYVFTIFNIVVNSSCSFTPKISVPYLLLMASYLKPNKFLCSRFLRLSL